VSAVEDLRRLIGAEGVLAPADGIETYERGYRYGAGRAVAVARPATTADLQEVVRYCFAQDLRVIAQGANTGLVAAATPDASGDQLILSLERMRAIEEVNTGDRTARVQAGTRLSALNGQLAASQLFFPIDLGADPSIGGMIASNTGGSRLLRYGDVQKNLLGLEVVLADADATVLTDMKALRKDNSGIDLKQLSVGTGGTFGIIAAAQLEVQRLPLQAATALLVPARQEAIPQLLNLLEAQAGEFLAAFEGMSANAVAAALLHNPRIRNPFGPGAVPPPYTVLVELSSMLSPERIDLNEFLVDLLGACMSAADPLITDGILGRSADLWAIRHSISDGVKALGRIIAFDISVPRTQLPALRTQLLGAVRETHPFLRVCDFGHCGDGGDHFNIVWPADAAPAYDTASVEALRELVYDTVVHRFGGSFSAEHGVGPYNVAYYKRYTSTEERAFAGKLKRLCDPKGILGNVEFGP
jgi:FAD/FMN-containing dehydrogenase